MREAEGSTLSDSAMERIPKKITPDSLLDTFVQVHYSLRVTKEQMLAAISGILAPEFSSVTMAAQDEQEIVVREDEVLFSGSGILFRVREKLASFNCSEGYIGWDKYRTLIELALQKMCEADLIVEFPRVSVRYINSLPWAPLNKQVRVKFPSLPHLSASEHTLFQTTGHNEQGFQINLVVTDNARIADADDKPVSLFDISVAHTTPIPMRTLEVALTELDKAHMIEKEVFFGMLSQDFLATLNPEY